MTRPMSKTMIKKRFTPMYRHSSLLKILEFIRKERVVTTGEVAEFLRVSWNSADSWLKDLAIDGKVERIKKEGGLNLWLKK